MRDRTFVKHSENNDFELYVVEKVLLNICFDKDICYYKNLKTGEEYHDGTIMISTPLYDNNLNKIEVEETNNDNFDHIVCIVHNKI